VFFSSFFNSWQQHSSQLVICCSRAWSSALYSVISPQLSNSICSLVWQLCKFLDPAEHRCSVLGARASYSGVPGLKSRPADRLYWLRCFANFLSCSRQMPVQYFKFDPYRLFPNPLQFIDHPVPRRYWSLCVKSVLHKPLGISTLSILSSTWMNCLQFVFLWLFCPFPGPGLP
jgi:hypothetical protein